MTISDRDAIRELLHAYCNHVDTGNADEWADLYTEDGSFDREGGAFDLPNEPVVGRQALRRMASRFRADGLHFCANEVITIEGDEATVSSYVLVLDGPDNPKVRLGGRYIDHLRKVDGGWRFASRRLLAQMQEA